MPVYFTTSQTAAGPFGTFDTGTSFVVMPDVYLIPTGVTRAFTSVANTFSDASLLVLGTVGSTNLAPIFSFGRTTVTVGTTGTVIGGTDFAIDLANGSRVVNAGWIDGSRGFETVSLSGAFCTLTNSGTITGQLGAVALTGLGASLTNDGDIVVGIAALTASGVRVSNSAGVHLANGGLISVLSNIFGSGILLQDTGATVTNTGTILCLQGWGIKCSNSTQTLVLTNSGIIQGNLGVTGSVQCGNGDDRIANTGHLIGDVLLGGGNDAFDTIGGQVTGSVYGGAGDDVYRISDPLAQVFEFVGQGIFDRIESTVSFSLASTGEVENLTLLGTATDGTGNGYANSISGNGMDNRLLGEVGLDTLFGGDGNDWLDGGTEVDLLFGGTGDDRLMGRAGNDTINGGDGDDWLLGGADNDSLLGGNGEDTLIGGAGRDIMAGGADADTFVFRVVTDSGVTGATYDQINGFQAGLDVLDLSNLDAVAGLAGNQAFAWLGTGAFTGAAGQLRYFVSGANIIVEGTVNADLIADFQFRLNGLAAFQVDDLML